MHANHQSQHENKVTFHSVEGKKLGMTITQNIKPAFPFPFFNLPPLSIPPFFPPLPLLSPIISVLSILLPSHLLTLFLYNFSSCISTSSSSSSSSFISAFTLPASHTPPPLPHSTLHSRGKLSPRAIEKCSVLELLVQVCHL